MIHYLPLEYEPMRYTGSLDAHICAHLQRKKLWGSTHRIYPDIGSDFKRPLPTGLFLDAPRTIAFKSAQMLELSRIYARGLVSTGDIVFLSDIWFPGIEGVRYLDFFEKKKVSLRGILHAGSFTDTDFVRQLERWAAMYENTLFDIFDKVIVASEFMKREVCSRRLLDERKVEVTPFPLDRRAVKYPNPRENVVVFNGRLCDEKQPHLFKELQQRVQAPPGTQWVSTQEARLDQEEYYSLLRRAKVVVSFALQENFGFGVAEATHCGCVPVVPDRLVYPEFYPSRCLYRSFEQCVQRTTYALHHYEDFDQDEILVHVASRMVPNMEGWFA